jgi:hypothetical protein
MGLPNLVIIRDIWGNKLDHLQVEMNPYVVLLFVLKQEVVNYMFEG